MLDENDVTTMVRRFLVSPARADLHHLVRIDPYVNRARRLFDPGWSCREHAVLSAALLAADGVMSRFVHGANMFVVGPTADGEAPYGLGNEAAYVHRGHSWLRVPGFGVLDISPRLNERLAGNPQWRPIAADAGWVGESWLVDGRPATLKQPADYADYGQEVAKATHEIEGHTAIYWEQETFAFGMEMLDADWVDSPLRERVRASDFDGALLALGTHLWALNQRRRRPLATVSQSKAWRFLSEIDDALVAEFTAAVETGLQG